MTRCFIVQFFPFEAVEDAGFLERFRADGTDKDAEDAFMHMPGSIQGNEGSQYLRRPHTVFSMDELVRYVIFRERLCGAHGDSTERTR